MRRNALAHRRLPSLDGAPRASQTRPPGPPMSALPPRGCEPRSRSGSGRLRRYVVLVGLAPDSFGRAMARLLQSGRTVTRLHAYDGGEGLRYLLVTRASLPGEARAYAAGMDRESYVQWCARHRGQGLDVLGVSPRMVDGEDVYDAILLRTNRPRA